MLYGCVKKILVIPILNLIQTNKEFIEFIIIYKLNYNL